MQLLKYMCIFISTFTMILSGQTLVPSKKAWENCKVTDDHNARNEIYKIVQDGMDDIMSKYISEVSKLKKDLEKDISDLKTDLKTLMKGVSFMATPSTMRVTPNPRSKLQFDKIITEQGNAYNNRTSTFTAPVSGYYFFVLTILVGAPSSADEYLILYIMKNNVISAYLTVGWEGKGVGMWVKRSENTLLHLSKGDRVYVKTEKFPKQFVMIVGYESISPKGLFNSHFSGFLIN